MTRFEFYFAIALGLMIPLVVAEVWLFGELGMLP